MGIHITYKSIFFWFRRFYPAPSKADFQLYTAVITSDIKKMRSALRDGAWVNRNHQGCGSALMAAVAFDNLEAVQILLKNGADPNVRSSFGETALQRAKAQRDGTIERILIAAGAKY